MQGFTVFKFFKVQKPGVRFLTFIKCFTVFKFFKVQKRYESGKIKNMGFTVFKFFKVQKPYLIVFGIDTRFTVFKFFKVQKPQIQNFNPSINLPKIWLLHLLTIEFLNHMTSHILKSHSLPLIIPNLD